MCCRRWAPARPRLAELRVRDDGGAGRCSLATIVSVAVVACAAADLVHELIGHGLASWALGDRLTLVSTVAVQNVEPSRLVAACGTLANLAAGALALGLLRRAKGFGPGACFTWLFAAFNLFNCGYLVASALLGNGDWAAVIADLSPALGWRLLTGAAGMAAYALSMRLLAVSLRPFVDSGDIAPRDLPRIVVPAYVAAGLLLTVAAAFNPISPSLILLSGAGASFGLNFGLLFIPRLVGPSRDDRRGAAGLLAFSGPWLGFAILVSAVFILVMGRGIRL